MMSISLDARLTSQVISGTAREARLGLFVPSDGDAIVLAVTAEWHVARARNVVRSVLEDRCFTSVCSAYIVTAVSELATNLFFHATNGGTITFAFDPREGGHEVVVVAEDDGPGIPNLEQALLDGFTTNGGLGGGLPGIERLMDQFEIVSRAGSGTRVTCRKSSLCR
ncbi:MAG: ATP-binding protein [Gemmatimonadota bacterium]|nr:ATP-binding protein [Gemmatimonadota bacterium]